MAARRVRIEDTGCRDPTSATAASWRGGGPTGPVRRADSVQCPVVGRCITVLTKIDVQGAGVVDGVGGTGGTVRRGGSLPLVLIVFFGLVGCADDGVGPSDTVPTTSEVTSETPPPTASSGPNRIVPIPTPSARASEHSEFGAIAFNVLGDDARLPVRDSGCRAIPGGEFTGMLVLRVCP